MIAGPSVSGPLLPPSGHPALLKGEGTKQQGRESNHRRGGENKQLTYLIRPSLARPSRHPQPAVRRSFAGEEGEKLTVFVCRSFVDATIVNAVVLIVAVVAAGPS